MLGVPDMKGRYFLLPFLDGWTNVFAVPGSRTTGTVAQTFLIYRPGVGGAVPAGMTHLQRLPRSPGCSGASIAPGTPGGLRRGPRAAGRLQAAAVQHMGKDYAPPPGARRSRDRHEDSGPGPGQPALDA